MSNNENTAHLKAVQSIQKKLLGKTLTYGEIFNLMDEIAKHKLGDVLTAYFVASSFKEGFSPEELFHLTKAMVETGTKLEFDGIVADKHSTGGVAGTRTTMLIVPIIAAAGFKIPKTSSRAITAPDGTADVMELLADVTFTKRQIEKIVNKVGGCIVWGGHLGIAPADDIIIRVEEPLAFESFDKIIISIMAKKVAAGTNHLVLDIPVGKTMKIRHFSDAEKVARKFRDLGNHFGIHTITNIEETFQPFGRGVGPYLEAYDVLEVLEQSRDRALDLEHKALKLAGKLLDICFKTAKINKNGAEEAKYMLTSGKALTKFKEIIEAQNGDGNITLTNFKSKATKREITAKHQGRVTSINNYNLNTIAKLLGAPHDKYAGLYLQKKLGDPVHKHEQLLQFHSTNKYLIDEAEETLQNFPIYEIT